MGWSLNLSGILHWLVSAWGVLRLGILVWFAEIVEESRFGRLGLG